MEKEWTIIFLIYADFREKDAKDLKKELDSLNKDLLKSKLTENVEILMIQNTINPKEPDPENIDLTTVFRIEKGIRDKKNFKSTLYSTSTRRVIQKKDKLGELFYKIHNNGFKNSSDENIITRAKRYFLVTWDHGSAFGIFRRDKILDNITNEEKIIEIGLHSGSLNEGDVNTIRLLQVKSKPANFVKRNDGSYFKRERFWEQPIYNYYSERGDFMFSLDSGLEKDKLVQELVATPTARSMLTIKENNGVFSLQLDKLFSHIDVGKEVWDQFGSPSGLIQFEFSNIPPKILDILTNEELGKAIERGFSDSNGKKKIEVLMMMNCTMMNVHSCYAFRNNVDYLVAPQSTISYPAYNYDFLLNEILESNPAIEARKLAEICVSSCGYDFWKKRRRHRDSIEKWVIICMDLTDYNELADIIDDVSHFLKELNIQYNGRLYDDFFAPRNLCARCDDLDLRYFIVDITHWLTEVLIRLENKKINIQAIYSKYCRIIELLDRKIIAERIGQSSNPSDQLIQRKFRGIGIYFPIQKFENEEYNYFIDKNSHNQSIFLREKKNWLEFLKSTFLK